MYGYLTHAPPILVWNVEGIFVPAEGKGQCPTLTGGWIEKDVRSLTSSDNILYKECTIFGEIIDSM
jgi:hypothetical protein